MSLSGLTPTPHESHRYTILAPRGLNCKETSGCHAVSCQAYRSSDVSQRDWPSREVTTQRFVTHVTSVDPNGKSMAAKVSSQTSDGENVDILVTVVVCFSF